MIKDGRVYIDGKELIESYLSSEVVTYSGQFLAEGEGYLVQPGEVMAFGDNREHSSDSREWGPVPDGNIVGRVFFRYFPFSLAGIVTNPSNSSN